MKKLLICVALLYLAPLSAMEMPRYSPELEKQIIGTIAGTQSLATLEPLLTDEDMKEKTFTRIYTSLKTDELDRKHADQKNPWKCCTEKTESKAIQGLLVGTAAFYGVLAVTSDFPEVMTLCAGLSLVCGFHVRECFARNDNTRQTFQELEAYFDALDRAESKKNWR